MFTAVDLAVVVAQDAQIEASIKARVYELCEMGRMLFVLFDAGDALVLPKHGGLAKIVDEVSPLNKLCDRVISG